MADARAIKRFMKNFEAIKTQTQTFTEDTRLVEIKTCLALLADEWKEFRNFEKSLKVIDDTFTDSIDKIESIHSELRLKLFRLEKLHEEKQTDHADTTMNDLLLNQTSFLQQVTSLNNKSESDVRLPRVNIPVFTGNYSEFPSFCDLFEASIHNNNKISKVHKLQYLKGLLKGDAYALISHITVTEAHYDEAWDKVKSRYNKQKHVISMLLKQFMLQPNLHQSCSKSLRCLTDTSDEVIRGLKALGQQAETRDPWLIYILINKLDDDSKEAWAHETAEIDFPSLDQLFKFLNKRSDALESLSSILKPKAGTSKRVSALTTQFIRTACPSCAGDHYIGRCDKFLELPIPERKQFAADKKLCFNCLAPTHQSTVCTSRYNCRLCRRRHHVTLHPESGGKINKDSGTENVNAANKSETASYNTTVKLVSSNRNQLQAILPTAIVLIKDRSGQNQRCRILLDSGSQSSFVLEDCVQRLKLQRERANIKITGITANAVKSRGKTIFVMGSIHDPNSQIEINALIINRLPSSIPSCNFDVGDNKVFANLELADPDFQKTAPIDIIIGADKFFNILQNERKQFNSTILQKTIFGWVVSGQPKSVQSIDSSNFMALNIQLDVDVDRTLRKFWEIEEMPQTNIQSPEDVECEDFYCKTHKRDEDGRYVVKLPFNKLQSKLGNSSAIATQRFLSLERKLAKDEDLREQYVKIMREYLELGHMIEIHPSEIHKSDEQENYYLPHHSVVKESSETTKIRIVFDGSSKSSTGISLNNKLMVGPTIQPTLWAILVRFRSNRIALTADIEKMYRQVIVSPSDTHYQRVLWRDNPGQKLRQYELTRVTFGLACSAFLAIRTLKQLAHDGGDEIVRKHVVEDFYVDDFLSGAPDIETATQLKANITRVLSSGGFPLRKWRSNHQGLSDTTSDTTIRELCSDYTAEVLILGLHWHPNSDILTYRVKPEQEGNITKRKVISEASRVFDPLGFLSPSVILLKILFQKLWLEKLDWDDRLPERYAEEYQRVRGEFKYFEDLKIPRFTNYEGNIQIHGFADASEVAYCAVIYSRVINEKGEITTHLLASKTKVAPIKKVSLPRLELCAAHLLVKLLQAVKETIAPAAPCYAWTDSTIVLAWLSTYPARWKTFVANRVSQILEKYPRQHWSHVKSADNPADHGTRGLVPSKLVKTQQWWYGPEWLKQPEDYWPTTHIESARDDAAIDKELSKVQIPSQAFQVTIEEDWLGTIFERKSSILKIFRIVAYVKRYVTNLRTKNQTNRNTDELTAREIEGATVDCVKWVQANEFNEDINYLRQNKTVKPNSKLISLAPFIDAAGILRVGGRLSNAECDYDNKHPIVIPANHIFIERLIRETHQKNLHAGPTLTNNLIRQKYWIINGRSKIRSLLKNCVTCAKYSHKTSSQLMGNLPVERVTPTRPFKNCGIDFAGPLYFATKKGRGGTNPVKGYLCVFVCISVKAVHIEPVSDLTSLAFLAALKRFVARRGVPENIYTDNGSNFIGARRILLDACNMIKQINKDFVISEYLSSNSINWHFIPPSSPHFGGLWESAVKSVKTHLLKSVRNVNLTFEEMATLLCQIEGILNSRPLCTTSAGDDYEVLTPAHFLIGTSIGSVPEKQATTPDSYLTRWHRIQARIQTFWKKYYIDYINNLQQRYKWQNTNHELQVDDIVLLKEDDTPVAKWPLGRIIQIHPGNDGLVRVVTIKTSKITLRRPVVKICRLPIG